MKKALLSLILFTITCSSFAKTLTEIVEIKGMSDVSESGDMIELYTSKDTIGIHVDYIDEKSLFTLIDAAEKKSCVKLTQTGENFPYQIQATKASCSKESRKQTVATKTIFSCFTKNGKHLSVEQIGQNYQYSYGRPGKPEMTFENSKDEVEQTRDMGTQAVNITMKNKGVEYFIWSNFRLESAAGVEVSKNGKTLANTECDSTREIYGLLE